MKSNGLLLAIDNILTHVFTYQLSTLMKSYSVR